MLRRTTLQPPTNRHGLHGRGGSLVPGAALFLLALAAPCSADREWHESVTPRFVVKHQSPRAPSGLAFQLEKLHSRLRRDLSLFSPWLGKERLTLYLYADRPSLLASEFDPPEWSNGFAVHDRKAVAAHTGPEARDRLLSIIAHETTHLLFAEYWQEAGGTPPRWLNEGLAMLEEGAAESQEEASPWYQRMARWENGLLGVEGLFKTGPDEHAGAGRQHDPGVERWYLQAYSVVYFLYRKHHRLRFKDFCAKLRDGMPVEEALWKVYRYKDLGTFEKDWLAWFHDPSHKPRAAEALQQEKAPAPPARIKGGQSPR